MTTANLIKMPSMKGNVSVKVDASKKLQEENFEVAEMFAGLMNQTISASNPVADDRSSGVDDLRMKRMQSPAQSYERYSYRDKQIDSAKEAAPEETGEVLEDANEEVIDTLCEKYGVDEETIQNLLDEMGLSALDLLNPQNLVSFLVQLTGVASGEELLLDENFLSVMETMNHISEELMNDLNIDMDGLKKLITDVTVDEEFLSGAEQETDETVVDIKQEIEKTVADENEMPVTSEVLDKNAESDSLMNDTMAGQQNAENFNTNENIVQSQTIVNTSQTSEGVTTQQFSSYLSADSVQIMEQIVQQVRVTITNEVKTMEMQMNPENLGKVYVNISSEEGVIRAQFHATNEIVKEALETQIATLRENLNQAGVKVDAIEVTIASHEFERNLEQNQQNPQEQMDTQEQNTPKRRNLSVDSLDELAGVMTEEETLAAQIMKDNGNSVDFTA